jgi:hypothetical protein
MITSLAGNGRESPDGVILEMNDNDAPSANDQEALDYIEMMRKAKSKQVVTWAARFTHTVPVSIENGKKHNRPQSNPKRTYCGSHSHMLTRVSTIYDIPISLLSLI